jgi:hypothetical protein
MRSLSSALIELERGGGLERVEGLEALEALEVS